jgi:D-beta-D-heptose 7-phosphate kinase/D-beta-D-heptose 1-phosphate adenosyltransferase
MLDVYLKGRVARISPEAPIPVVELTEADLKVPGGAANVACNITALGGRAVLVGVVGRDTAGRELVQALRSKGVDTSGLVAVSGRPTTEKIRVIAHTQQVVRVDREVKDSLPKAVAQTVLARARRAMARSQAVLLEDYNKGVLSHTVIRGVLSEARRMNILSTVDPKFQNFFEYQGATVVKPNWKEALEALGVEAAGREDAAFVGKQLVKRLKCRAVMVTRGEMGMTLFEKGKPVRSIPTMAREVYDVSGAGDTVIATLTLALASGAAFLEASALANFAAGVEVGKLGVATVSAQELLDRVLEG